MIRVGLAILGAALLGGGIECPQQPTFTVRVELVSVDVLATSRGQAITGLKASDFEVRDNGVRQKIDSISGEGTIGTAALQTIPLDVILVLDTSGSMASGKLEQLIEAGRGVLDRLRPSDRAALVAFSHRLTMPVALTADTSSIRRALDQLSAFGRTSMYDALYAGLMLRRTTTTRCMVLLFSDGQDNTSWLSAKNIREVARQSDVVLYAVGLDSTIKDALAPIAQETGGDTIVAESAKDLKTLFVRMVREMQARYVLTYYPRGVTREGWHTIDVRLAGRKGDLKARRGYYVPGG
jgi:VWFA-related protein